MKKKEVSLFQILDPKYKFDLTLYLDYGIITFNSLSVEQLASLLYPYFKRFSIKASLNGTEATLVFHKGNKRVYASISIVD